jgi:nucleotide-binding universal stress UspA family protein
VARVVVVASSEVDRSELEEVVGPDDELVVVAPAVEQSFLQWLANDEGDARERAREVAESVDADAPTDAERVQVKPDDPVQLVRDAVAEHNPDRIVLAVREGEDATWIEQGELGEAPSEIAGVPVQRIRISNGA